ncbi:shikimate dehydrogenase [Campylobacter upsaliensis]|uniref:shikimate dehydrogenase n=1 Tax=Campylobacter upsaliensis TaxID=28080 RepID=UPI002149D207|nr:shikimate dehydrogenase [Campylobacter upsaliensis]MCR2122632.1 shikimate dehydrogenase [Campylobacter upsaliensis]
MKFFCVIGDPISHSKSPRIHNNAIKLLGLNGIYTRFHLKDKEKLKESLFKLELNGANITLPFKEEALKIADFKDYLAEQIGSANTLILKENQIYAYNTDAPGFLKAIEEFKDVKKALILGAGGTARAIAYALKQKNITSLIANRSEKNFAHFKDFNCVLYEDLKDFNFDLIINSTSAGLSDACLPCDVNLLKKIQTKYAFEVIYGKKTPFIKFYEEKHIKHKDGLDMLLWQGVFAFELFFDLKNRQKQIQKTMLEALNLS